jgi:signal transduction histidine kinase
VARPSGSSRLVNQVLDMAKIESGHARMAQQRGRPGAPDLAQAGADHRRDVPRARRARLVLDRATEQPVVLVADPDRLMQVLLNLLSNAAKFVPRRGPGRRWSPDGTDAGPLTRAVQDNGPGVPPVEQRELIFEKFRQGGDAANRPQGTGLGLPISRQIVEHFGGRLWLDAPRMAAPLRVRAAAANRPQLN